MKKQMKYTRLAVIALGLSLTSASYASLVSVTQNAGGLFGGVGDSSLGGTAAIIAAPGAVLNAGVTNTAMQGFNEKQNVVLGAALAVDGGVIAAGTAVNSHMIFFNAMNGAQSHRVVKWTFGETILGVMSDSPGALEGASSALLGAMGTTYPAPFAQRGMEIFSGSTDTYTVAGTMLTVTMAVTATKGDWIRVITQGNPPGVPDSGSTALLLGAGLLGLVAVRRKIRR